MHGGLDPAVIIVSRGAAAGGPGPGLVGSTSENERLPLQWLRQDASHKKPEASSRSFQRSGLPMRIIPCHEFASPPIRRLRQQLRSGSSARMVQWLHAARREGIRPDQGDVLSPDGHEPVVRFGERSRSAERPVLLLSKRNAARESSRTDQDLCLGSAIVRRECPS